MVPMRQHYLLLRSSFLTLLVKVVGAIIAFGLNVYLARNMEATVLGDYYICISLAMIFSVLARMGMDNSVLRAVSANEHDDGYAQSYVYRAFSVTLIASLVLSFLLFLSGESISGMFLLDRYAAFSLKVFALCVPALALAFLSIEIVKGFGHASTSVFFSTAVLPGIMLIVLYFMDMRIITLPVASGVYLFTASLTLLLSTFSIQLSSKFSIARNHLVSYRTVFASATPNYFSTIFQQIVFPWSPILYLGHLGLSAEVAFYSNALRCAQLLVFPLIAINAVAAPKLSRLYARGEIKSLAELCQVITLVCSLVSMPLAILGLIYAEQIMGIFGPRFIESADVLRILIVGQLINCAFGPVGYLLMMTKNEKANRNCFFLMVVILLFGLASLTPIYGIYGTAVAVTTALITYNFAALIVIKRLFDFWVLPKPRIALMYARGIS